MPRFSAHTRTIAAAGGLVAAAALVVPLSADAATARQHAAASTMKLGAHLTSYHAQNAVKNKQHAGDRLEFTDRLTRSGTTIGHDAGSCSLTDPKHFECDWTLVFAHGSIQLAGLGRFTSGSEAYHLAIVGGTGTYAGAGGTMTVTDSDKTVAHYRLIVTG